MCALDLSAPGRRAPKAVLEAASVDPWPPPHKPPVVVVRMATACTSRRLLYGASLGLMGRV